MSKPACRMMQDGWHGDRIEGVFCEESLNGKRPGQSLTAALSQGEVQKYIPWSTLHGLPLFVYNQHFVWHTLAAAGETYMPRQFHSKKD